MSKLDTAILEQVNTARKALGFAPYGDKRSFKKIDIYAKLANGGRYYIASTTWARSCKEAREMLVASRSDLGYAATDLVAHYAAKR